MHFWLTRLVIGSVRAKLADNDPFILPILLYPARQDEQKTRMDPFPNPQSKV